MLLPLLEPFTRMLLLFDDATTAAAGDPCSNDCLTLLFDDATAVGDTGSNATAAYVGHIDVTNARDHDRISPRTCASSRS